MQAHQTSKGGMVACLRAHKQVRLVCTVVPRVGGHGLGGGRYGDTGPWTTLLATSLTRCVRREHDGDVSDEESDRRNEHRAPIELKVEYKRLNSFFADYTKNISRGGTFIRTSKPLDIGTGFVFKLIVPKLAEPLALRGRVQWVIKPDDPEGREPGMGIG